MDWRKLNVQIVVPDKVKKFLFLVVGTWLCTALCVEILDYLPIRIYRVVRFVSPILSGAPAIIVFIKEGQSFRKIINGNILKQVVVGIMVGAFLLAILWMVSGGIGRSVTTSFFAKYDWYKIYITIYYLLVVGFVEEFVYRVVIQDYFVDRLKKYKFCAPLISAIIFGLAHYFVGGWNQVLATFLLGLVWGYLKYCGNNSFYLAASISHGLYDYGIIVIPYFVSIL